MNTNAAKLTIDGTAVELVSAEGREAVGAHFRIQARALGGEQRVKDLLGKPFELESSDGLLSIAGVVLSARATRERGAEELALELGPAHALLEVGQDSQVYLAKTSVDIVRAVLSRASATAATFSVATPPTRELTTQYREPDWTFIDRLVREDGFYWFYDHGSGSALTFADDSTSAPAVEGELLHRLAGGVRGPTAWVSGIRSRTTALVEAVTTRDYDPKKPSLAIEGKATAASGAREVYEWPAVATTAAAAKTRAGSALESLRARAVVVTGQSDRLSIQCGKIITIDSNRLAAGLTSLFVIAVEWSLLPEPTLTFTAVPSTTKFRLPVVPRTHVPLGPETAWVRGASGQEIDVDSNGDVFVQPPWDRNTKKDDTVTIRARAGQMQLGRSMTIPRVGWGMLVGHLDGDVDRPWSMARLVDGAHPPPYKLPDEMTKSSWQTLTSSSDGTLTEIVFEDKRDAELMAFHASRDMSIEIGNDEARTVGNNHTLEVTKDRAETTEADEKLTVTADQATTVKGAETTTIEGSRSLTVKGDEEATVSGKRGETVTADLTVDIGKKRTLTVTGAMSAKSKKGFTREVLKKLSATSAAGWTTKADGGLVTTTKGDAEEVVAAACTQNGKTGILSVVKGKLDDTVAAAHALTAKGSVGESAKGKATLTVGAALTATAPEIEIVGKSEITIVCGGNTITIKSSEVTIKAAILSMASPIVVLDGAQVKHNP